MHPSRSLAAALFLFSGALIAQDTIHVRTLSFDSITTRRGTWLFPDTTHHFRKVLMHQTLKCDAQTTQDQYACGEWDYLTYMFVYDHTGVLDSTAQEHAHFLVGTAAPDSVELTYVMPIDLRQREVVTRTITGTQSETDHSVGLDNASDDQTFGVAQGPARSQFAFTAAELNAAGLGVGAPVERLRFQVINNGGMVDRLIVRMKLGSFNNLNAFDNSGLTTVYDHAQDLTTGTNTLDLTSPFTWDGSSDLLVEFAMEKQMQWGGAELAATDMGNTQTIRDLGVDGYLEMNNDFIGVAPNGLATLGDQVTVTFWAYGDSSIPVNTTMLEAVDANNNRILNIHLPWSDGSVYWDAGNDGAGYDRINKAAQTAEVEGQWNHWAFVKNATTGQMKIYLNGTLWHSGTGKTKPMNGIVKFRIGSGRNGEYPYPGLIDEFNVFGTEVSGATIAAWSDRRVDNTHPNAPDLLYSYHFDELPTDFTLENSAVPSDPAWPMGTVKRGYRHATALSASPISSAIRPDLTFVQGTYSDQFDTSIVADPDVQAYVSKEDYQIMGNAAVPVDTAFAWSAGYTYTYDPTGVAIDSTLSSGITFHNDTLNYFGVPFEVVDKFEIGRYITPYGIQLNLGPNGFTWTYDVTDYQYLLHDSVDLSAGNQQELIDLEFEMIEGTAPRPLVRHQRPWGPQASYSFNALDNDTRLEPMDITLAPDATQWELRTRLTGHGDQTSIPGVQGCCEFRDNTHYWYANGSQVDDWHIWRTNECALNPVYPQGGTWLYAREGWCPGDVVRDHATTITPYVSNGSVNLDYRITPVPANNPGMGGGNYVTNVDLFEYGPAAHALDAEVYNVVRPSDEGYHARVNPMCFDPVVVLRNAGGTDLTSATFTYGISGGPEQTYTWTGDLVHMATAEVTLPIPDGSFWLGDADQHFTVTVSAPNGGTDGYADNDSYTTHFELPVTYTDNFIVYFKTNNRANENTLTIRDVYGNAVYSRTNLTNNTTYADTLSLYDGCYEFEVTDSGNDGFTYWADPGQGSGFLRFKRLTGSTLKSFETEFGRDLKWAFTLNGFVGIAERASAATLLLSPNPTTGPCTMSTTGLQGPVTLRVVDPQGRDLLRRTLEMHGQDRTMLDLSGLVNGLYTVVLNGEDARMSARVQVLR
ncbi:MAG: hypothetical protein H6595_10345 [Flavobacteriales bacterium]|nr:hypothetical protein [Flavobacteriales bacterium]MCB9167861.1 hypothetical protein [Flavobacteriales bacterium]